MKEVIKHQQRRYIYVKEGSKAINILMNREKKLVRKRRNMVIKGCLKRATRTKRQIYEDSGRSAKRLKIVMEGFREINPRELNRTKIALIWAT